MTIILRHALSMSVHVVPPLKARSLENKQCTMQKAARRVCSAGLSCSPDAGGAYGQDSVRVVGPTRVHSESHPYAHDQRSILRAYGGMPLDVQDAPVLAKYDVVNTYGQHIKTFSVPSWA